jgi:hypothetical protein
MALSTRRRSDRTRAAQVHHFRLRPARLAANHARHDHSVFAMPMPRGTRAGSNTPRSITTLVASSDIDQVSDEESGRGRNRPIRSLPVRDFCSGAYTDGRPARFPWPSHYAPSEVLLKRKPRSQSSHAISQCLDIKSGVAAGQSLSGAVHLVIKTSVRESEELGLKIGKPRRLFRKEYQAAFEFRSLNFHAAFLVSSGLDRNCREPDGFHFRNKPHAYASCFDKDFISIVPACMGNSASSQRGKVEPVTQ